MTSKLLKKNLIVTSLFFQRFGSTKICYKSLLVLKLWACYLVIPKVWRFGLWIFKAIFAVHTNWSKRFEVVNITKCTKRSTSLGKPTVNIWCHFCSTSWSKRFEMVKITIYLMYKTKYILRWKFDAIFAVQVDQKDLKW